MACYHPLKGFPIGITKNGKVDYKITGYDAECVIKRSDRIDVLGFIPSDGVIQYPDRVITDWIPVPCGQCIGCRLKRSKDWATRCMLETKYHSKSYFLTFTYDDFHVPVSGYVDKETGELCNINTLYKKDLQDFWKRLRRRSDYLEDNFKYYACGEYGSITARPHYHAIVFGINIPDLVLWKNSRAGYPLYNSEWLTKIWKKGYVVVGDVTFESCAYVARYIMKKQLGQAAQFYDDYNLAPEFNCMSLKPAIGLEFFEENFQKMYENDEIILPEGRVVTPPRYFDKKFELIDEEEMQNVKDKRADIAERLQELKLSNTDKNFQDVLLAEEANAQNSLKKLVRIL